MILNIDNLSIALDKKQVLKNISFCLEKEDWLAVIGPNGAGKSTLLKSILQINDNYQGHIFSNNENLKALDHKKRAQLISYVPQITQDYDSHFSVWDIMLMSRYPYASALGGISENDLGHGQSILEKFDLTSFKGSLINNLSGGERQRVMLAAAFFQDTEILVMDEPTSFLDPVHQEELIKLLSEFKEKTIILVTHDLNLANLVCNKTLALNAGKQFFFGETNEFDKDKLNKLFDKEFKIIHENDQEIIIPVNYKQ